MIRTFEKAVTKSKIIPGVKLKISANDHFIVTDNGKRILVDTGCPYDINENSMRQRPGLRRHLEGACGPLNTHIDEFWGMEFLEQHKVLFDYQKETLTVADPNDNLTVDHLVADFPISGLPERIFFDIAIEGVVRKMIFDTGAAIANYLTEPIVNTEKYLRTVTDFHPMLGYYDVDLYEHSVKIGGETVGVPFGVQPEIIDQNVRRSNAFGVVGIGLYEKFQVMLDLPNRRLALGRY